MFWREMAQLPKKVQVGSVRGERETYRYAASSFRTKSNEEELFELVELSEVPLDKEVFKVVLELLKLNVAPSTILQVLKTLRSQATHSSLPPSLHDSRSSSRTHSPLPPDRHTSTQSQSQQLDQRHVADQLSAISSEQGDQKATIRNVTQPKEKSARSRTGKSTASSVKPSSSRHGKHKTTGHPKS